MATILNSRPPTGSGCVIKPDLSPASIKRRWWRDAYRPVATEARRRIILYSIYTRCRSASQKIRRSRWLRVVMWVAMQSTYVTVTLEETRTLDGTHRNDHSILQTTITLNLRMEARGIYYYNKVSLQTVWRLTLQLHWALTVSDKNVANEL